MIDRRKATGARGESAAVAYLRHKGYSIVATNWRCRRGEIDIVAQDGPALVFVEVRTRNSRQLGTPEESVTPTKQRRLVELAETYLHILDLDGRPWNGPWRIDVVALQAHPARDDFAINHVVNAVEGA